MGPQPGTTLVVDPNVYYNAAKKLYAMTGDINTAVARNPVPGLTSSAGMAGNYPAVSGWNSAYREHSGDVRTVVTTYAKALQNFGDILNVAGYNWDTAEYNANPNPAKGAAPPKSRTAAQTRSTRQPTPGRHSLRVRKSPWRHRRCKR
jgi:hypothetical protein